MKQDENVSGPTTTAQPEGLWEIADVAAYLKVKVSTVRKDITERGLPCKRIGGRLYFRPAEVSAWVDSQGEAA